MRVCICFVYLSMLLDVCACAHAHTHTLYDLSLILLIVTELPRVSADWCSKKFMTSCELKNGYVVAHLENHNIIM